MKSFIELPAHSALFAISWITQAMLMRIYCLICQLTLASLVLSGCQPVYYGATSIIDFDEKNSHTLTGKDYKAVLMQLGEPSDITLDRSDRMIWIYEVDKTSSNPMQILPTITIGQAVERKLLLIGFSKEKRVISVDIEKSETRLVGLIGHIDHGAKRIEAKRRVRYVLDRLDLVNGGKPKSKEDSNKLKSNAPQSSSVLFKFTN